MAEYNAGNWNPDSLRTARLNRRLLKGQVAARIGVAYSTYHYWEDRKFPARWPRRPTAADLARGERRRCFC